MTKDRITLILTGDIMLGGNFLQFKEKKNMTWEYPFEKIKHFIKEEDIVFGNLECPLFKSKTLRNKLCCLHAPPNSISALKYLNYDVISLANNHITDQGDEGVLKTIEILKNSEIKSFGAGKNLYDAEQKVIIKTKKLKFAFLGYTTSNIQSIMAGSNNAGCVPYDIKKIILDIKKNKSMVDIICVSLHWGCEYYRYPSPKQLDIAHKIIDAGAHVVIGHHPHVVQGFERYKHGIIFYSLGNFFFPDFRRSSGALYQYPKESKEFIIAKCEINIYNKKVEEVEILPGFMNQHYQLIVSKGKERKKLITKINQLSETIKRTDYESFWYKYSKRGALVSKKRETNDEVTSLIENIRKLGLLKCIKMISLKKIKYLITLLIKYIKFYCFNYNSENKKGGKHYE